MTITTKSNIDCLLCHGPLQWWGSATDWEYFTSNEKFDYYQCTKCKSIFLPSFQSLKLDIIYPNHYYSFQRQPDNFIFSAKKWFDKQYFKKVLRRLPGKKLTVLDIGGGNGEMAGQIRKIDDRVHQTTIIDINEQSGAIASASGHEFILSKVEDFTTTKQYDFILLFNLIEHVADPKRLIQNICSWLTPTGICLLKTPNADSWDARIFRHSYWGGLHTPRHWTIFSESGFMNLVKELPLTARIRYTQGAPFWTYSLLVKFFGKQLLQEKKPLIQHPLFPFFSACFAVFDMARKPFAKTSQFFIELRRNDPLYVQ
ncbi:MAG TPA: class I SAM-dependent methyltransferase [Flavitalea sp.]|nr:class I SAM-dependent methyltransferase [Flavitalea sp.]